MIPKKIGQKFHERPETFHYYFFQAFEIRRTTNELVSTHGTLTSLQHVGDDGQAVAQQDHEKAGQGKGRGKSNFVISDTFEGSQLCTRPVPVISLNLYQALVPAFSCASCNNLIVESRRNSVRASMGIEERGQGRRITQLSSQPSNNIPIFSRCPTQRERILTPGQQSGSPTYNESIKERKKERKVKR